MRTKRHNPEELVTKLRQVDVLECLAMRVKRRLTISRCPRRLPPQGGPNHHRTVAPELRYEATAFIVGIQPAYARIRRSNGTTVIYSLTFKLDQSIRASQSHDQLFQSHLELCLPLYDLNKVRQSNNYRVKN